MKFKKPNFLSVMVILSLLACMIYGVVAILFQYFTGDELSPTLTENWYLVFGVEIAGTTLIYITKRITSIWRVEDKLKLKKEYEIEITDRDFNSNSEYYEYGYDGDEPDFPDTNFDKGGI